MNGIYIPGLNMPNSCVECLINYYFCHMDYKYFLAHQELYDQRSPNCPLVPVPPHGRLIEAEPIVKYVTDGLNSGELGYDAIKVMTEIEYAPTIIQASKEVNK